MPTLKMDGQNCCVLLIGLRNDYYLLNFFVNVSGYSCVFDYFNLQAEIN